MMVYQGTCCSAGQGGHRSCPGSWWTGTQRDPPGLEGRGSVEGVVGIVDVDVVRHRAEVDGRRRGSSAKGGDGSGDVVVEKVLLYAAHERWCGSECGSWTSHPRRVSP